MRIVALCTLFGPRFFENEAAIGMLTESITFNLESVAMSHLAQIIKHGVTNVVALCAPQFYPKLMPFLQSFLSAAFKKLDQNWKQMLSRSGSGSGSGSGGGHGDGATSNSQQNGSEQKE